MKLFHLFNKYVRILRMTAITGHRMTYSTVTGEFANIQPQGLVKGQILDGIYGKSYIFHCDIEADIKPGDKLRDEDNNFYIVKNDGVTIRSFGSIDYMVVMVEKIDR